MEKNHLDLRPRGRKQGLGKHLAERKVGFYIRVSTEEQAENPEGSIKNQEERLKMTLALKNSDQTFGTLAGVYCDAGRSGKDMNRPELKRLIQAIEAGAINMVMVSELSRLSRSIKDFSQLWEFMQAHGCGFLSLRENFDTSTAAGEMMLYSIANFAQFERRQTSERVSANFLARAQRGLWNGGVLPIGYEPDPNQRGSLRIVEEEAKVVRTAFEVLIREGSVSAAAKWLYSNGVQYNAPLRGGGGRPRLRHFTFDSLYRVLSNPAYAGVRVIRSKRSIEGVSAVWPAIIDPKTFEKAKLVLEAGKRQKTGRESRYPYLLSTRIYCGECKSPLIGVSAHGMTTKVPYYGHGNQLKRETIARQKEHRCTPFRVPGKKLEERVWKEVLGIIESPTHRAPLFRELQKLSQLTPIKKESERRAADLGAIEYKLSNLAKRVADLPAGVPADPFFDEMKRLTETKVKLQAEIQHHQNQREEQAITTETQYTRLLARLKDQAIDVAPDSKRRIIQTLVQRVTVRKDGFDLDFKVGMDQIKKGELMASPSFSQVKKISGSSSFLQLNGGSSAIVGEPTTAAVEVPVAWIKPEIDPAELARLRNEEGLTMRELSRRYGVGRTTLWRILYGRN